MADSSSTCLDLRWVRKEVEIRSASKSSINCSWDWNTRPRLRVIAVYLLTKKDICLLLWIPNYHSVGGGWQLSVTTLTIILRCLALQSKHGGISYFQMNRILLFISHTLTDEGMDSTLEPQCSAFTPWVWNPNQLPFSICLVPRLPLMMCDHLHQILGAHFSSEAAGTQVTIFGKAFTPHNELAQLCVTELRCWYIQTGR